MSNNPRLNQSCRVALAALLHDLGKFAERARIQEAQTKDADGNSRQAINEGLYCPTNREGRRTHIHAAYTAIGMDLLETHLPELVGEDMAPFAPWREKNADDSIINAAARHHRPETFLQWLIATADRLASGFERETFASYNAAPDEEQGRKLNHYTTRQWTLLEGIALPSPIGTGARSEVATPAYRYPLSALSPDAVFPVLAKDKQQGEHGEKSIAQKEYLALWNGFVKGLADIPVPHRRSLPLWIDHFESLWLTFTHAIPSATAGIGGKVRPDVSLFDHSKTTAALAVALWRYHSDQGHDIRDAREQLCAQWDRERSGSQRAEHAWKEPKLLLVQGDFFGIQHFIFAEGSQTQKRAARLLRGRSFYISLLTELAALKVLEALDLPATSQVVNAAGKFLIVAPNTPEAVAALQCVQGELNDWFLEHTYGQTGIGLAWLPAAARDFRQSEAGEVPFRNLMKRLFEQLEAAKLSRFDLCGGVVSPLFQGFLARFEHGECRIDGRSPGSVELEKDVWVSALASDQISIGKWLASEDRLLITRERIMPLMEDQKLNQPRLAIFGYHLLFTRDAEKSGKFGSEAQSRNLLRAWDFSLPESGREALWNGYARRHINGYVPHFRETDLAEAALGKYDGLSAEDREHERLDAPKTLNHLARDDRHPAAEDKWIGAEALMTLKGDVDNLGLIFQQGLTNPTFAKMAALSRQMNAFFAVYLPWLCAREYPNTYSVFAGGDDFFLIVPWHSAIGLAERMKDEFRRYVAENPDIHFSAGLSLTKPGLPIRQLAALAEEALDAAKSRLSSPPRGGAGGEGTAPAKNAVTCFGETVSWADFDRLLERAVGLKRAAEDHELSKGYLYSLLHLTDLAGKVTERPENAIWHSRFAYSTRRLAETRYKEIESREQREAARRRLQASLAKEIASEGIERYGDAYKIALFTYLYQQRD